MTRQSGKTLLVPVVAVALAGALAVHFSGATPATTAAAASATPQMTTPQVDMMAAGKGKTKTVELAICPITHEKPMNKTGGTEKVGIYNVLFCCSACRPTFDKLSPAEKNKRIQEALKAEQAGKKTK